MKCFFIVVLAISISTGCQSKSKNEEGGSNKKTNSHAKYTASKDGIEEIKIGMKAGEVEKITGEQFQFKTNRDIPGYWTDTMRISYKEMPLTLYFERMEMSETNWYMQLSGVETTSDLCKTATGIGIGDDKMAVVKAYDDYSIDMGPDYEQVNDSTWLPSKTKYSIHVRDTSYMNQISFRLTDKKITAIGASMIMGD